MKKAAIAVIMAVLIMLALSSCAETASLEDEDTVATVPTIAITDADVPQHDAPSPERISEIEQAWYKAENNPLSFEAECVYYTNIEGYDIFILPGLVKTRSEINIGGYNFEYDSSFTVYAYKSGVFNTIADAYKAGTLSQRDIAIIAYIHQKMYDAGNG